MYWLRVLAKGFGMFVVAFILASALGPTALTYDEITDEVHWRWSPRDGRPASQP